MAELSLGTRETAGKLGYGKLTIKHREGPSQLVLKVEFLERGLGQGSQQDSGRDIAESWLLLTSYLLSLRLISCVWSGAQATV